ncbi:hypothetical protein D0866_16464 [Hortaea werneckii]|uniref:ADF-H domain-containing protein n=1 Tax=Hortaea werneckii TaxID=91943 RepID=A0A3M6XYS6_HORWE|nr:hypothetical protein D0866_16464 [Hortaea werneckii]
MESNGGWINDEMGGNKLHAIVGGATSPTSAMSRLDWHLHQFSHTISQNQLTRHPKSSEARLYTFSPETKNALRKFRLGTSRAKDPQAVIYQIDKSTMEIKQVDETIYSNMQELSDELPDNSPRYVLLSYPLTMVRLF